MNTAKDIPFLSVVIPAYNEAKGITKTLQYIVSYLNRQPFNYEILVVDDGSNDGTSGAVRSFAHQKVECIRYEKNRGKGFAVRTGMLRARGTYRLFLDADHSVSIENCEPFLDEIQKGYDIVIASISVSGATIVGKQPPYRHVLGKLSKWLIQKVITHDIRDTQRGFKLFKDHAAITIFNKLSIYRWGFDMEVFAIAAVHGLGIKEVPVVWTNPPSPRINVFTYFHTFIEFTIIKTHLLLGHYR